MPAFLPALAIATLAADAPAAIPSRPDIVWIMADDLGYGDIGVHGCTDIPTPYIDGLAARGVRCSAGYSSHPYCSPMRAGLIAGRYQQRFGYENNIAYDPDNPFMGLPLSERTIADRLAEVGYTTAMVGKWHLGASAPFHPLKRGFDQFFGFLGGGHDYFTVDLTRPIGEGYRTPLCEGRNSAPMKGYLTDQLSERAAAMIAEQPADKPLFLNLAYNAPHTPLQAPDDLIAKFASIKDRKRRTYAAMVFAMDRGIGTVLDAIERRGRTTLIVFLSDNGGPEHANSSDNGPLRGEKGDVYEGGIRVPFLLAWDNVLPPGTVYDKPVISLDLTATAAAIAGAETDRLDGTNLIPHLRGEADTPPHAHLFWRSISFDRWAVRDAAGHKLLDNFDGETSSEELFDLASDLDESAPSDEDAETLRRAYDAWNAANIEPLFNGFRGYNGAHQKWRRQQVREIDLETR